MLKLYSTPAVSLERSFELAAQLSDLVGPFVTRIASEYCYYIHSLKALSSANIERLAWLMSGTGPVATNSFLEGAYATVLEVGPRLNFESDLSTTAVSIARACGVDSVLRIERSVRYGMPDGITDQHAKAFLAPLHDRMTQVRYSSPLRTLTVTKKPKPVRTIDIAKYGLSALRRFSKTYGCGWDEFDLNWIYGLFHDELKTNPTDVVLFKIAQSITAEHSRHGFWKGHHIVDGVEVPQTLMEMVKQPWRVSPGKTQIAFSDNSSSMGGGWISILVPLDPGKPGPVVMVRRFYDRTATAETHNHPTFIEPYEGAGTGVARVRDMHAVGRGGLIQVGALAIMTGNLCVPGYVQPWEKDEAGWKVPEGFSTPLQIMLRGTSGAYDFGNCLGEPTILGATRTFGMSVSGERRSWYKPVLYSGGFGQMDRTHRKKGKTLRDMLLVHIGGLGYRIGLGGGAGSSLGAGDISAKLAFNSVQRSGPEMQNRADRVVRTCVQMGRKNPIVVIHDVGAGGVGNTFTEIAYPEGARIEVRNIPVGDKTLSVMEIWSNESQERDGIVIRRRDWKLFKSVCDRERCPAAIIGRVTGDGWLVLHDDSDGTTPVKVPLDKLLGKLPQKTFHHTTIQPKLKPLRLPKNLTVAGALSRVLRHPTVASKRFLTSKVDCSVGGRVAQSQCVGPNQLSLSDYAVKAESFFPDPKTGDIPGTAMSLGEQPITGLINPAKMARLAVAEALTNLAGARIESLLDVQYEANWMWAAKKPGEGARIIAAAQSLKEFLLTLGQRIDGGKDSLSMTAQITGPDEQNHEVKAPGQLILAAYAAMDDVTVKVTCDFKRAGNHLYFIDLSDGREQLGGSILAQCYGQIGNDCPDTCSPINLFHAFQSVQIALKFGYVESIHDVSDGGLITTLLEMAFAGNLGFSVDIGLHHDPFAVLFSQGPGLVIEVSEAFSSNLKILFYGLKINCRRIGQTLDIDEGVVVYCGQGLVLREAIPTLRAIWEETSSRLDALQANPLCVDQETAANRLIDAPRYVATGTPVPAPPYILRKSSRPQVAVIREQGTNGDAEMRETLYLAGFRVCDIAMSDLLAGRAILDDRYSGIVFPGGFSFKDVFGAGRGWAGVIRYNDKLARQFERFRKRPDTFSLGVCNGCQLMTLMGWAPGLLDLPAAEQPRFIQNTSRRFESRWVTVRIEQSPSIMLSGHNNMAGSVLGVWVAHGEGRYYSANPKVMSRIMEEHLAPVLYTDPLGAPAETYPFNPNGSRSAIAGVCSPDGRHLAMMPHPERAVWNWQWGYAPQNWNPKDASPWLTMFQNAYHWCTKQ